MKIISSTINTKFWWLKHDWVTYKVPVAEGKLILPQDHLAPGFEIDQNDYWYSFPQNRGDRRKKGDFSAWTGGTFFVNKRAFEVFKDMFLCHGRVFPVQCSNLPHFIVLIDSKHAAVDMRRSKFKLLWDDGRPLEDDISQIKSIVLKQGFSTTDDIFRTDNGSDINLKLNLQLIVSDRFKTRYEQANFTGLVFRDTGGGG